MAYPGGKNCCFQRIINLIPPHDTYIETHLGSGAVMRNKRPASVNIGIEIDPAVRDRWPAEKFPHVRIYGGGAICTLKCLESEMKGHTFIYADPPYLNGTRTKKKIYKWEYTDNDHRNLLGFLKQLASPLVQVMISGYWSRLYAEELKGWNFSSFEAMTRTGMRTEYLWMSYPTPERLHDYRYLGDGVSGAVKTI